MRKPWFSKVVIWSIILSLIFPTIPFHSNPSVLAQETKKITSTKTKNPNVQKIREVKEKRTKNSRTWKNSDLTETMELFPSPIFYQEEKTKEWKEIKMN